MARLLSGLALVIFFVSCGDRVPRGVVPKRVMPDLLFDIHVLDGRLSSMPIDSARRLIDPSYEAVFKRYRIDSVQFKESIHYYSTRPAALGEIYAVVNKRIQALIEKDQLIRSEEYRIKIVSDSLKAVQVRDSLHRRALDSLEWIGRRHLLFRHEADSTVDKPVPMTFESLSRSIFEQLGLLTATERQPVQDLPALSDPVLPDPPTGPWQVEPKSTLR